MAERTNAMNRKLKVLALCSYLISLAIFMFSYVLYHYLSPTGGFTAVYQAVPAKPMVTYLFAIWGVTFLFASVMSLLVAWIFFPVDKSK